MILTKKIEVIINENDYAVKSGYLKQLYIWRSLVRNGANELISYLYSIDRLKYYKFITQEAKIELGIIGAKGESVKEGSASYVLLSERLKGLIPMDIANSLQQNVTKTYKESRKDILNGSAALKSYNNLPIPFSGCSIRNLNYLKEANKYTFTLFGLPFSFMLGKDRSNNKSVLDCCIAGEIKICGSSLQIDDNRKKTYLLLNVDIPKIELSLEAENFIDAQLSIDIPIVASFKNDIKMIGNKEEYLHRRIQIQKALKRAQINSTYTTGGRGRKRKTQALERFNNKEKDYINTRLHTYSKLLIDFAIKNRCKTIYLINQKEKEKQIQKNSFLLRNWGYYGLKQKLIYKASLFGINIIEKAS
ncbi:MAG: hypothetical protein A2X19_00015 [Bacteroidetes bacterium GWE2_39_28]|nr:MAG: hypothetical protein A2X19_00015 [Bacteroidetes bacterium GWE2_39_28]OFY14388.1 MAG: hypothetical protein A2X16_05405 [Bacteroidetes bacterium GWF2_39_10]OFZ10275.1 MAG: hypothetical protein A2465_03270 [Bacteroidetes bacterium RIFOXYC2_FULL_39_11]HCT95249.1 hypothetical protein [Rikenellaceae bacterium]